MFPQARLVKVALRLQQVLILGNAMNKIYKFQTECSAYQQAQTISRYTSGWSTKADKKSPLLITAAQAEEINKAVKTAHIAKVKQTYDCVPGNKVRFDNLPAEAQTVIISVSFQYGANLKARAPKFLDAIVKQDWAEANKILKAFGDAYPTRRRKEAELLGKIKWKPFFYLAIYFFAAC